MSSSSYNVAVQPNAPQKYACEVIAKALYDVHMTTTGLGIFAERVARYPDTPGLNPADRIIIVSAMVDELVKQGKIAFDAKKQLIASRPHVKQIRYDKVALSLADDKYDGFSPIAGQGKAHGRTSGKSCCNTGHRFTIPKTSEQAAQFPSFWTSAFLIILRRMKTEEDKNTLVRLEHIASPMALAARSTNPSAIYNITRAKLGIVALTERAYRGRSLEKSVDDLIRAL